MSNKYLAEEEKQYRGKKPKVLVVNWDRLEEEGLWSNSNSQRMQKKALKIAISVNDMVEELQDSKDLQFKRKHNHHIGRNMGLPAWWFFCGKNCVCLKISLLIFRTKSLGAVSTPPGSGILAYRHVIVAENTKPPPKNNNANKTK